MQNLICICENQDVDLRGPTATQAAGLPPEVISTEPVGTHLPHGSSQAFLSLLEKDMMLARTFHILTRWQYGPNQCRGSGSDLCSQLEWLTELACSRNRLLGINCSTRLCWKWSEVKENRSGYEPNCSINISVYFSSTCSRFQRGFRRALLGKKWSSLKKKKKIILQKGNKKPEI